MPEATRHCLDDYRPPEWTVETVALRSRRCDMQSVASFTVHETVMTRAKRATK